MCHQYNDDTSSEQQLTIRATVCEYFFSVTIKACNSYHHFFSKRI